jgi:hypothetical protein
MLKQKNNENEQKVMGKCGGKKINQERKFRKTHTHTHNYT